MSHPSSRVHRIRLRLKNRVPIQLFEKKREIDFKFCSKFDHFNVQDFLSLFVRLLDILRKTLRYYKVLFCEVKGLYLLKYAILDYTDVDYGYCLAISKKLSVHEFG